jgi:hypothetical protein
MSDLRATIEGETPAINPKASEQAALKETIENNNNTNATLTIKAPKGVADIDQDEGFFPSILSTVTEFF